MAEIDRVLGCNTRTETEKQNGVEENCNQLSVWCVLVCLYSGVNNYQHTQHNVTIHSRVSCFHSLALSLLAGKMAPATSDLQICVK